MNWNYNYSKLQTFNRKKYNIRCSFCGIGHINTDVTKLNSGNYICYYCKLKKLWGVKYGKGKEKAEKERYSVDKLLHHWIFITWLLCL